MNAEHLQEEFFHLIAYMITSARGLYEEPADYGVFRLLDSAGRLLDILQNQGLLTDRFLLDLKQKIDAERENSMDNERQRRLLDEWILAISEEMRRRLD
ncbi:MAG: DUF6092 family protein [Thermanaerothrix sp.]|uniref:DUF6092 family protein n=1 Tax=Thermanaerothrix sp. TaxID=2972675 RepID=UPI003C7BB097